MQWLQRLSPSVLAHVVLGGGGKDVRVCVIFFFCLCVCFCMYICVFVCRCIFVCDCMLVCKYKGCIFAV